jgi:hypothetical protein
VTKLKKSLLLIGVSSLALLSACQYEAFTDDQDFYSENGKAIHVSEKNETYNQNNLRDGKDNDIGTNFGFVRHQKSPIPGDRDEYYFDEMPALNRENLADIISKMAVLLPNVNDVATLVTDEEVLVAYETDSANRFETADQVKKTAISVVPRYFHVYVSDNPRMIKEIEKYGQLDSNSRDIDQILDVTIAEMLNSPQGRNLNDGENANGEAINEMNDGLDEDFNNQQNNVNDNPVNMYNRDVRNGNGMNNNNNPNMNERG